MQENHPPHGNSAPAGIRLEYQREAIAWCITIAAAVMTAWALASLIQQLYRPDSAAALQLARTISIRPTAVFNPKPLEKLIFTTIAVSMPFSLAGFYLLATRTLKLFTERAVRGLFYGGLTLSIGLVLYVTIAGFTAANPFAHSPQNAHDFIAKSNLDFYLHQTFLQKYGWVFFVIFVPAFMLWGWRRKNATSTAASRFRCVSRRAYYLWCSLLMAGAFAINVFEFPYTFENKYDFSAVYYSVIQVYFGVPMLVDGFTNTYGLYPHFVAPLLKVVGLDILYFSALMALLIALSYAFLARCIADSMRSSFLAACCFTTIIFYGHFFFKITTSYDSIFASQPIRFIFPMLSLLLAGHYLEKMSWRRSVAALGLLAVGILWNPEFGILNFLAYVLFLIYCAAGQGIGKHFIARAVGTISLATGIVLVTAGAYAVAIRLTYNAMPDLAGMLSTLKMFSIIGAGMLDMPLLHPWNAVAIIYLVGLLYAIAALLTGRWNPHAARVFHITMLGVATFSYYEGRSHNWNLLVTAVYAFLLLGIFADKLRAACEQERFFLVPRAILVALLASSLLQVAYSTPAIAKLFFERENKYENRAEQQQILADAEFIRERTSFGEKVLILSADQNQALLHGLSFTASSFNPGFIDLFLRSDHERVLSLLANNRAGKVFITPATFRSFDSRIGDLLSSRYQAWRTNGSIIEMQHK